VRLWICYYWNLVNKVRVEGWALVKNYLTDKQLRTLQVRPCSSDWLHCQKHKGLNFWTVLITGTENVRRFWQTSQPLITREQIRDLIFSLFSLQLCQASVLTIYLTVKSTTATFSSFLIVTCHKTHCCRFSSCHCSLNLVLFRFASFRSHSPFYLLTVRVNVIYFHLMPLRHTPQSAGLLWTRDRPVAEISTWQHTTLTRDKHTYPRWDSNPRSQ
jgi:hypothetical protein